MVGEHLLQSMDKREKESGILAKEQGGLMNFKELLMEGLQMIMDMKTNKITCIESI